MADNQITPFKLTDQFTMDNFNQRINETNTALQNKAPAGFGLGENSTYANLISDCNQATKNGWYWTYENVQNAPMDYGLLHVCCNGTYIKQEWWDTPTGGARIAIRVCNGGTWMPWEWVNPLMQLGVEYRTTERYLGKPVYVKAASVGDIAANTLVVANNFSNGGEAVVRCFAIAKYSSGIVTSPQNSLFSCTLVANGLIYTTSNNQVRVLIKADSNMTDCVAVAYYTKA